MTHSGLAVNPFDRVRIEAETAHVSSKLISGRLVYSGDTLRAPHWAEIRPRICKESL